MSWDEFCTLLSGLMPETPLGQIVSIRAEEDENMLKNFTADQKRIRDEWRRRQMEALLNDEEAAAARLKAFQEMCRIAFGGG